jgi:hypothetical protein
MKKLLQLMTEFKGSCSSDLIDTPEWIYNHYSDFIYMTHDSSLNEGIEFKTHPFTFNWYKRGDFKKWMTDISEHLISEGWKSNKTSTCGFHIHMTRHCFTKSEEFKLVHLFNNAESLFRLLGQRQENSYCIKNDKNDPYNQRGAINFTSKTIELRFPKGNLRFDRICKNVEMAYSMVMFVKTYSFPHMNEQKYLEFILQNEKDYPNLIEFLRSRDVLPKLEDHNPDNDEILTHDEQAIMEQRKEEKEEPTMVEVIPESPIFSSDEIQRINRAVNNLINIRIQPINWDIVEYAGQHIQQQIAMLPR